jgi:hypothetical protein
VRFEVFGAVKIEFVVFWAVAPCSVVACWIPSILKVEAAWSYETLVSNHYTIRREIPEPMNCKYQPLVELR